MGEKSFSSKYGRGLSRLGKFPLIFLWLFLVFAGLAEGFAPGGLHRPVVGTAILVVPAVIFLWTMRRWAKIFTALCAFFAFMSVVGYFIGSFGYNTPIRHAQAAISLVAYGGAAFFTGRFRAKDFAPRLPDRLGALAFVSGIFWGAVDTRVTNLAFGMGLFALFAAWLADRLRRRRDRTRHNASHTADAT